MVQTNAAKNSMLNMHGVSPHQFVFGRRPRISSDLLQDSPSPVAADAVGAESAVDAQARIRQAARMAVIAAQDCKMLREALRARPRLRRDFESGQWVAYWRNQKWEKGNLIKGCRLYGPALVLGKLGRNVVVAHRNSILRCAPGQLRPSTDEERPLSRDAIDAEGQELLGMQQLLNQGKFPKSQMTDMSQQEHPPTPEGCALPMPSHLEDTQSHEPLAGNTAAELLETAARESEQTVEQPARPEPSSSVVPQSSRPADKKISLRCWEKSFRGWPCPKPAQPVQPPLIRCQWHGAKPARACVQKLVLLLMF